MSTNSNDDLRALKAAGMSLVHGATEVGNVLVATFTAFVVGYFAGAICAPTLAGLFAGVAAFFTFFGAWSAAWHLSTLSIVLRSGSLWAAVYGIGAIVGAATGSTLAGGIAGFLSYCFVGPALLPSHPPRTVPTAEHRRGTKLIPFAEAKRRAEQLHATK